MPVRPWLLSDGDTRQRFMARVSAEPTDRGCLLWAGVIERKDGYGVLRVDHKNMRAHRVSWMLSNGPIPPGAQIRHRCDNPPCVNPDHLLMGSPKDNTRDAMRRGRLARGEQSGNAKLTDDEVREIRRLHATTAHTHRSLAVAYGVSRGLIGHITRRRLWRHI